MQKNKNKNKKESKTLKDLVILTQAYFTPKVKEVETVLNGLIIVKNHSVIHSLTDINGYLWYINSIF